jgi:hypothetical protein
MKKSITWAIVILLCFTGCNKAVDYTIDNNFLSPKPSPGFILYTIKKGEHYVANNFYQPTEISELKFAVKFDSSAIYQTNSEVNQYDINKLYGFSDNNADHHQYSARVGWSWNNNSLHLHGYVYNEGKVLKADLGNIAMGAETMCSIKVNGSNYIFSVNDVAVTMPRSSTGSLARGYMLYPYFGGDETAPHDIRIWIKNL